MKKREQREVHENLQVLFIRFFAIRPKRRATGSGEQFANSAQSVARGFGPTGVSHRHLSAIQFLRTFKTPTRKKTWSFRETAFDTKKTRKRRNGTSEPRLTGHFTVKKWAKVVHTLDQANPSCEFIARLSSADGRKPIFDRLFAHRRISVSRFRCRHGLTTPTPWFAKGRNSCDVIRARTVSTFRFRSAISRRRSPAPPKILAVSTNRRASVVGGDHGVRGGPAPGPVWVRDW